MTQGSRRPPGSPPTEPATGLVDAERLLALTGRLKAAHARIEQGSYSARRRRDYQRRLAAIAEAGQSDLGRADAQLQRLEAQLERHDGS